MTAVRQLNFSKGIVSSSLFGRVDTLGYQTGLRKLRNTTIMRSGGLKNRAGTLYAGPTKNPGEPVRAVDFVFSVAAGQSYVLIFGDEYMWVAQAGDLLTDVDVPLTAISNAAPGLFQATAHGLANGRVIYISGVVGMTEVNGRYFQVADATTNTFRLKSLAGTYLDTSAMGVYTSGGTAARVFQITTPYDKEDLADLQWSQVADVMRLTCPGYPVQRLTRSGHTSWAITPETFQPVAEAPVYVSATAGVAGDRIMRYRITAVDKTGEESNYGLDTARAISGIALTSVITVTAAGHGYEDGDELYLEDIVGTTELNDRLFIVRNATDNTFELEGEDGTGLTAYISGGTATRTHMTIPDCDEPSDADPNILEWLKSTTSTVNGYRVYRQYGGVFGLVGETIGTRFKDTGFPPDTAFVPPVSFLGREVPFSETELYPAVCGFFQERQILANTPREPNGVNLSQIGFLKNFGAHFPVLSDDAFKFTIPGTQINEIRHLVDLRNLVIMTSNAEYVATGADGGALSGTSRRVTRQSSNGSSTLRPLQVGGSLVYVQARGKSILDFFPDELAVDGYKGGDLTVFCDSLFRNRTIVDWAYQQIPDSIIWIVLDDGSVVGLTYIREQQMIGFHQHDTLGLVKNVCVIPEGNEDVVYFVVEREIDGETVTYLEQMQSRTEDADAPEANVFVDCGGTYNGWNTDDDHTMEVTGSGWTPEDTLTLTSSEPFFTEDDEGNMVFLRGTDEDGVEHLVRFRIVGYTSATVVSVQPDQDVPEALQGEAISDWARAVDELGGLWHLEGQEVSIQGDAFVDANPNNPKQPTVVTVTGGRITLPESSEPRAVIHVGLPYVSDIETLDMDTTQGETLVTRKKLITAVAVSVESSRGIWAGEEQPATDNVLGDLREYKSRQQTSAYAEPPALLTGVQEIPIKARWNEGGRVFLRQVDPGPMSILAIIPQGTVAAQGGR